MRQYDTRSTSVKQELEYEVLAGDVVVYRHVRTTKNGEQDPGRVVTIEGFTSVGGLKAFQDGADLPYYSTGGVDGMTPLFGTPELLELLRTQGWDDAFFALYNSLAPQPFTRFARGRAVESDLVFLSSSNNFIVNVERKALPSAFRFEYIGARIDNSRYNLEKAVTILEERTDIRWYIGGRWDKDERIHNIPSYNAERCRNAYLDFVWMPDVASYREMWAKCLSYGTKYPLTERYRAVFDLDLLGLRAGGAALFSSFHKAKNESSYDDYDEDDADNG